MASRKDLFQSYQSSVRRLVSGLVLREADPARTPMRRMGGAVFGSVMVAALTLAVAGVIGVVRPGGNTTWQTSGSVVVEEETGARFAYLPDPEGTMRLHPVPNLSSGALLMGTATTVQVSAASLEGVPRGPRLGIPDAPDSMPAVARLLGAPWTLCSTPPEQGSGDEVPDTQLVVGRSTTSGDPVGEAAVLARDVEDGSLHLVWAGHQFPVPQEDVVLEGLNYRTQPQVEVGTAWLDAMPAGSALAPDPAPGRGEPSALAGAVVGEVRVVGTGEGAQFYQVTRAGIEEITAVQADLLLADPEVTSTVYAGRTVEALPLSAAEANAASRTELPERTAVDPPAVRPEPAEVSSSGSTVCASFAGSTELPTVSVQAAVEGTDIAATTGGLGADGTVLADRVVVTPGGGAVVLAQGSATATTGGLFLVTDSGTRYPVPDQETLEVLGYAGVEPVPMPSALVARLPVGPTLDASDALLPL